MVSHEDGDGSNYEDNNDHTDSNHGCKPCDGEPLTVASSGSDKPEVWAASSGALPGATPPPVRGQECCLGSARAAWKSRLDSLGSCATARFEHVLHCALLAWGYYPIRDLLHIAGHCGSVPTSGYT